jgi:hypothetical protein
VNDKTQEEILVRKANLARERLLAVVDELDRKRHNLAHPVKLVSRNFHMPQPVSIAALGGAALFAIGTIGFVVARLNARKARQARAHPLRKLMEKQLPQRSFWADVGNRTAKALITFGLIEVGKLGMRKAASQVQPPVNAAGF